MTTQTITTLDELYEVLRAAPRSEEYQHDADEYTNVTAGYAESRGLPTAHGEIDWTSLPTFGGNEPANTTGVWSWDTDRVLVGAGRDALRIVSRSEWEGRS